MTRLRNLHRDVWKYPLENGPEVRTFFSACRMSPQDRKRMLGLISPQFPWGTAQAWISAEMLEQKAQKRGFAQDQEYQWLWRAQRDPEWYLNHEILAGTGPQGEEEEEYQTMVSIFITDGTMRPV